MYCHFIPAAHWFQTGLGSLYISWYYYTSWLAKLFQDTMIIPHSPCWFLDIKFKEFSRSIQALKTETSRSIQGKFTLSYTMFRNVFIGQEQLLNSSPGYKMHFKRQPQIEPVNLLIYYQICNNSQSGMHNNVIVLGGYKMLGNCTWKEDLKKPNTLTKYEICPQFWNLRSMPELL